MVYIELLYENKYIAWTYIKYIIITTTLYLTLTGCSINKNTIPDNIPLRLYESAQQKMKSGNYKGAIKKLEALDNLYPFNPYAQQVHLDLIYNYYKSTDLSLVQNYIDRLLRLNPIHPNIDYILYMLGLTNMDLDDNVVQSFFRINRYDRNPENARAAFRNFMQLINKYPNSYYSMDATKRLIYLKNRLAKYELSIVKYYNQRGAYIAVINRVEQMLCDFSDTQATRLALPYMERAYLQLQLINQANKVTKIIVEN